LFSARSYTMDPYDTKDENDFVDVGQEIKNGEMDTDVPGNGAAAPGAAEGGAENKVEYDVTVTFKLPEFSKRVEKFYTDPVSCGGFKWRLMVFPRGLARKPGYVGIFVECMDLARAVAQVHVEASLVVVAKDPLKNFNKSFTTVLHSACSDHGWDSVCLQSQLRDTFLVDDVLTCTLHVEVPDPLRRFTGRSFFDRDYRKETGMVGLVNQGALLHECTAPKLVPHCGLANGGLSNPDRGRTASAQHSVAVAAFVLRIADGCACTGDQGIDAFVRMVRQ